IILFSSREFSYVTLSDAYSTGSSLMPQKKNPDTLELARGKSGRLMGNLVSLLTMLKGLPSTYDKDLQEDKEPVFDSYDTLMATVPVLSGTVRTLQLNPQAMRAQLEAGLLATDLADYLVQKGMPFRQAHEVVGRVVRLAEEQGKELDELDVSVLRQVSEKFEEDVAACFDFERSLNTRQATGGTARAALGSQLEEARRVLALHATANAR
ncbi:MAG: argininosuccinate lyase, partial [Chloroflexota bacterium]